MPSIGDSSTDYFCDVCHMKKKSTYTLSPTTSSNSLILGQAALSVCDNTFFQKRKGKAGESNQAKATFLQLPLLPLGNKIQLPV